MLLQANVEGLGGAVCVVEEVDPRKCEIQASMCLGELSRRIVDVCLESKFSPNFD